MYCNDCGHWWEECICDQLEEQAQLANTETSESVVNSTERDYVDVKRKDGGTTRLVFLAGN